MSAKIRASSARITSDKACTRLNERNALKSQMKVPTYSVTKATTRAILNVRITPENETQNEAVSKNIMMVKKDGNLKSRKKGSALNSPKSTKRTNRVCDKSLMDIKTIDPDRENDDGFMISNEILTVAKNETDSKYVEETECVLDESNNTLDTRNEAGLHNDDINKETICLCNIANNIQASCGPENMCYCKYESNVSDLGNNDILGCDKNTIDDSDITSDHTLPRQVQHSNQIQQRFPLRSKLKKSTYKITNISNTKKHSNIPKTKEVTQINDNVSESHIGKVSTAKPQAARGGKQCQSKLPSSKSKLTPPSSKTVKSNNKDLDSDKTVSVQNVSFTTLRSDSPHGSDASYYEEQSERTDPKLDSVIHKTCSNTDIRMCKNFPDTRSIPDEPANGYLSETDINTNNTSTEPSDISFTSVDTSSLTKATTTDESAVISDKTKCIKQTGVDTETGCVKRTQSWQESRVRTNLSKKSTIQTQLRTTSKHSASCKTDKIGVMNNNKTTLKSRQRSVTHEDDEKSDLNQERNKKSISLVSQSNNKSRFASDSIHNERNTKQTEVKSAVVNTSKISTRPLTNATGKSRSTSDRFVKSQPLTQNRFTNTELVRANKAVTVPKLTDLNQSSSSTSSRDSKSSSKSRSTSRSRSSTPSSNVGIATRCVNIGDSSLRNKSSLLRKSSSRDSSSRSRSSTPSVTSSVSDDNRQEPSKNKRVKQNTVTKKPDSKLKIPLRKVPSGNTNDNNTNSDISVKSKFNRDVKKHISTEKGEIPTPSSARKLTNNNVDKKSEMTHDKSVSRCSSSRNSNSRSRSATPEEAAAHAQIKSSCEVTLQKTNIQKKSDINTKLWKIVKPASVVALKQNGPLKHNVDNTSRESTSRSRSSTPSSAASADGTKGNNSPATNKTRRKTNNSYQSDKACISRQNENIKQQGSIPNKRMIKAPSGIPAITNTHSADIKDNEARNSTNVSNSSTRNGTRTTTPTNCASKQSKSKFPLTVSTPKSVPKLQKRTPSQKSQNVQSQITQRLSPVETDKLTTRPANLSMQSSTSIKHAKITMSTENKSSKSEHTTLKRRTNARPENSKSDQKRNKAFVAGNKSGLITSLSLIKKDNVSSCLVNKSDKQSSLPKRERKSEIERNNLSLVSALKPNGTNSKLDNMNYSIQGGDQGILSDSELTLFAGRKNNEIVENASLRNYDKKMQNTHTDMQVGSVCVETDIMDQNYGENANKNELKFKYQHGANLISQEKFDASDNQMESADIHHMNSSKNKSAVVVDPSFEVNINCLSSEQLNGNNSYREETWLEMNHEESISLKHCGSIDEKLQDLCQENMSKFQSEIESLCVKNSASCRNSNDKDIDDSITKFKSTGDMCTSEDIFCTENVCVEIICDKHQCSTIDDQDGGTIILMRSNQLNSTDEQEVNNYATDLKDKYSLLSENSTSVPSHACKCQDDKKSENSTFEIDMYDINSSQQMPIIDVNSRNRTDSYDFSYDKASNIVAATPSGAFSLNTNKRQDKKIIFDSSCVLCNASSPCIHMDVTQPKDVASVCVTASQSCELNVDEQRVNDSVNELNLDNIFTDEIMDQTHLMDTEEMTIVPSSDSGNNTECNGAVINLELIKNEGLSDASHLNAEQRCDIVADNSEVLDINEDDDALDEQQLVHDDFNTKMPQNCENYSPSVPSITSNIEPGISDWQETFLCDNKSPENNTDVELQVPYNSEINKETSCNKSVCTSMCICSNGNKRRVSNSNIDKSDMDIISGGLVHGDIGDFGDSESDNTNTTVDKYVMDVSEVQYTSVAGCLEHTQKICELETQTEGMAYKNDSDLVTSSPVLDMPAKTDTRITQEHFSHPADCDSLVQHDAKQDSDEWTLHTHCSHEENVKLISGGYDRSFHGPSSLEFSMQNTSKNGQTSEINFSDASIHDLSFAKCENEPESGDGENLIDTFCQSETIMTVRDNRTSGHMTATQPVEQHKRSDSQNIDLMDNEQTTSESTHSDYQDVETMSQYNFEEAISTDNTVDNSWGTIHENSTTLIPNLDMQCEHNDRDHPTLESSQNILPPQNIQISRSNDVFTDNLSNNKVPDIIGILPSNLLPSDESTRFQPDVSSLADSNNIDKTTDVREIRENLPKCFDNTINPGDMFAQQVINYDITDTACATCIQNKTIDTWAEVEGSENKSFQNAILPIEMNINDLSTVSDSNTPENLTTSTQKDCLQEVTNASHVCPSNAIAVCTSDKSNCDDRYHGQNTNYEFQTANDGSFEFQTVIENISECQSISEKSMQFPTVCDITSDFKTVIECTSPVETLHCSGHISDNLVQDSAGELCVSAVPEMIHQSSMLSEQSALSDSDSSNVQDINCSASQVKDLSSGHTVTVDVSSLSSIQEHQTELVDCEFQNNTSAILLQSLIDPDTCLIEDQIYISENSEGDICAPSTFQNKLVNEQFDNSTSVFDGNTCTGIDSSSSNESVCTVKTPHETECLQQEFIKQNEKGTYSDLNLVDRYHDYVGNEFSLVNNNFNVTYSNNEEELNTSPRNDRRTNIVTSKQDDTNESELNLNQLCATTIEYDVSDICDTFVDAEDSNNNEQEPETNDIDTKQNRLSLVSVNTCTSTDSFVDAVESLDDEYLTTCGFRHSREIQNEETLSQTPSDTYDASSDISDSIDDLSGWEEFSENIEDIGDINSSEMEIDPHKMSSPGNRLSKRPSELQHCNSVTRIRSVLQDKYYQNNTPSKRETITGTVNEATKIRYGDKTVETDRADISGSIFKTGNVCVSGEVTSQCVKVEAGNDLCAKSSNGNDNGFNRCFDSQSRHLQISGDSTFTSQQQLEHLKEPSCNSTNGHLQSSDSSVGSRIETALIKRTQRRRRRHGDQQYKSTNQVNSIDVNDDVNVIKNNVNANLNSKDGVNSGCTENVTCTHSRNSEISHDATDNITFNNKTTSGNESLLSQNNTGIVLNIMKINTNLNDDKHEHGFSENASLREKRNVLSSKVDANVSSVSFTITTETVDESQIVEEPVYHTSCELPNVLNQTVSNTTEIRDINDDVAESKANSKKEVTDELKLVSSSSNGTGELDDIEFIDADADSESSSKESSDVSSPETSDLSIDQQSIPSVCVTISLCSNVEDSENEDDCQSEGNVEADCTSIEFGEVITNLDLKVESVNNVQESHDESSKTSIFADDISYKVEVSMEPSNEYDKHHDCHETCEYVTDSSAGESSTGVQVADKTHPKMVENIVFASETTDDDLSSLSPDSNNSNTEIVEESNISVKHALEIERLKLADTNDVRSRKALFDSKRSGRRATIETSSIDLDVESGKLDNEEQKPKVAKKVQKSKSFRYERKVLSPNNNDDKTAEAERAVSPVNQKVSDICKSFMTKTRTSIQRTRDKSTSKSPAPQRKLMKWVNAHGKWLRIPVDDMNESLGSDVSSPDYDVSESKSESSDNTPAPQLSKQVEDSHKRNDTQCLKGQPPPVPIKGVENRTYSDGKEFVNSPVISSKCTDTQLESISQTSMPSKEISNTPTIEHSYKDLGSLISDGANDITETKLETDNGMSVPIGSSIIVKPDNDYVVSNSKCSVNNKTCNEINTDTNSPDGSGDRRTQHNDLDKIEDVNENASMNNDKVNVSHDESECLNLIESDETCSNDVKVIGSALEHTTSDQDTHFKRQELLFGLLDSYNRRKPRRISQDEISRRCASPIGMRTGYTVNMDDDEKADKENATTEKAISIPKIKAIKIQEEVFECKSEYIKDNNLKLNDEMRSFSAQKTKLPLRKSKTFSGMDDFERKYEPQIYDSFRKHESNVKTEHSLSSVNNKQVDRHASNTNTEMAMTTMGDKRARAGLKLQIDKAKNRSSNSAGENSPNRLTPNQANARSHGDRSPNRLAVNQPMVRVRSPDKGPRIPRPKLLSEIVEVEENKDDISVSCDRQQHQQRHLKDRNKPEVQRAVKGSNKRRSLSLPTGTLAFGEARVVFKNGHFTIETMDGLQIDSSRPALYQTNVRMSESQGQIDDNWSMPDTSSRDEFANSRVKSNSREITVSDQDRRPMRRQYGKAVLQSYDSSEDVFYSESEILESVHGYRTGLEVGESRIFSMGRTSDDVFNESCSSRTSDMSVDSYVSDRTDISMNSDTVCDSKKLSSSSLPEQKDEEVKRVMQRAKRTSSFRAAQEAGASRLSGIHEDQVHESGRSRSVSVDESQNSDLNKLPKTQTSQNQKPTFLKKVMAKRNSFNENLNISTFAKQSESAKEFFSKKMTLKGLFKKNKSESSVGSSSLLRMEHPSSPPLATFQDDDIASVDTPPSSPYHGNREFRGRRHTSADIYRKSFQPDSSETDSNCPTPTIERSGLSHLSVSTPSTPSHKSGSCTNLTTSQTCSHDDVTSIASVSSISSSVHSPPSEQPNKPKTPKPIGASPRRNPSFGSQLSRTGSQSSQRNVMNSVTSLDGENYEPFTDDALQDPRCECGNRDTCPKHRTSNSAITRGSSDSLNTLCRFCKQMDYYYKTDNLEQKHLQSKEKLTEDSAGYKKDSPARTNLERLGIIAQQADVASSNSNDSGIQRDASVHSSNESIKGVPDGHVRLRRNKSLSPHPDRPKSEIAVRWADGNSGDYDLVESPVKLRHRESSRDRPRPKSDLEGSSFLSDRMKAFGSEINLQPYCSLRNLYEMRRRDIDKQKNRRMSTPHPIKTRLQTTRPHKLQKQPPLVRSSSMPESLEKIHKRRKMHHLLDFHLDSLSRHMDIDDCMSDGSDLSFDQASLQERSVSIQSSNSQLTSMDEDEDNLTYAEALWDHITLDPEEIGFCAQDVIQVLDMDDKDWWYGVIDDREGWFPANFVRLRVNQDEIEDDLDLDITIQNTLMSSPKLRRISMLNKDQARSNVVNEIINAEREYVKHLKDVVEGYIQHARKRTEMFPEERIRLIFGNIETIYSFAQKFLSQLEMCIIVRPHLSEIGQCFLDNDHGFEIYSDYCNNHPSACEELDDLCKNSKYKHFFEACRLLQELVEIPLEGFLLTPVQKICKYPLQLAELLKYTPPDHADYVWVRDALAAMRKIATLINERKRKMESIEKIAVWQHSVVDWEGPDLLERSSELIFSGELNKINSAGWSQERFFFLFDHQLVYCKKELLKRHVFSYKGRIDLDHCDIIDIPDGKDTQYNVTVKHGWKLHELHKDKWYLVYAKTEAVKQHWLKAIKNERKRVLEDQENDFCVPDHWKQTVLNKVRSQSNIKDKQSAGRHSQGQLMLQKDLYKDFTYSTLPRLRSTQKHDTKKKGWFKFGTGKKSKR